MSRPLCLDLYSGAGGAARGYMQVGFEVHGIDAVDQPRYAGDRFFRGDALEYVKRWGHLYNLVHASPPCQHYSWAARRWKKEWPDLVAATRAALRATGKPYVIENVVGAPLHSPVVLCGEMFGLGVIRHRLFESNMLLFQPHHRAHRGFVREGAYVTVAGHGGDSRDCSLAGWRRAMQIDWMTKEEIVEAIPPAYTKHLGEQLLWHLEGAA